MSQFWQRDQFVLQTNVTSPGHNQKWVYGNVIRTRNMAAKAGHTIFSHF